MEKASTILTSIYNAMIDHSPYSELQDKLTGVITEYKELPHCRYNTTVRFKGEGLKGVFNVHNREPNDGYGSKHNNLILPDNYIRYANVEVSRADFKLMVSTALRLTDSNYKVSTPFKWYKGDSYLFNGTTGTLAHDKSSFFVDFKWDILGGRLVVFKSRF